MWTNLGGGAVTRSPTNCQIDPWACKGAGGPPNGVAPGAAPHLWRCDPSVDPACETELTTARKGEIRAALNYNLRPLNTITDLALRARCEEMTHFYLALMDSSSANNPQVFAGAYNSGNPPDGKNWHYGAFDPTTRHIHFDPWGFGGTVSSLQAWNLANSALHETAHWLNHEHSESIMVPYRGTKVASYPSVELYFGDLNPGPSSCLKY